MNRLEQEEVVERCKMVGIECVANADGSVSYCGTKTFDYTRAASDMRYAYDQQQEEEQAAKERMEQEQEAGEARYRQSVLGDEA
jgi:hypothetical protein